MNEVSQPQLALFLNVGMTVAFTFVWMSVFAFTAFRYVQSLKDGEKAVTGSLVLWGVTVGGLFTGPCALLFAVLGVFVAGVRLARKVEMNAPTRAATIATFAHSSVMLLMLLCTGVVLYWGGFFG
ncbi:MAG: hypothetical protein AB8I08_03455 [Sandaracinaceae bacterium]